MSSGHEEQFAINNSKKYINSIEEQLSNLREEVNKNSSSSENIGQRVRTNMPNTIVVPTIKISSNDSYKNYYASDPSYLTNVNYNSNNKAGMAAVLMVAEILALIILVALVTFVAFHGLS